MYFYSIIDFFLGGGAVSIYLLSTLTLTGSFELIENYSCHEMLAIGSRTSAEDSSELSGLYC